MSLDTHEYTHLTADEAALLAADLYGLHCTAARLPSEYDENFHLTAATGEEFVLKVMHPGRERSFIDLQCQALQHVARSAPALSLPRVCTARDGGILTTITGPDGAQRLAWMLTFVPGRVLAEVRPHSDELLFSLGKLLGQMNAALIDFTHPAAQRELKWDLTRAAWIRDYIKYVPEPAHRALVDRFLALYESKVLPALGHLRRSIIHGDANDYNVLVATPRAQTLTAVSVIDYGDMHYAATVAELAVAAAYALLDKRDPLAAAAQVVAGYHSAFPLAEAEMAMLYPLICARLSVSVVNSAYRRTLVPDDPYVTISERPAWQALDRLATVHPRLAHYTFRSACGLPPVPQTKRVVEWLRENANGFASILDVDVRTVPLRVFDLSPGSLETGADPRALEPDALTDMLFSAMKEEGVQVGIGRYDEARMFYRAPLYASGPHPADEFRTIHLGLDLFAEPGTGVHAPLEGTVHAFANNTGRLDYGPVVILRHATDDGQPFFTLYGHLSTDSITSLAVGQRIERGQRIGSIGEMTTNGEWPPHLHLQLITDLLELDTDFPGVAFASQRDVWKSLSPDPNAIVRIPEERLRNTELSKAETLAIRRAHIGGNLSISYNKPLKIVRGWRQYLYDETGRAFLDVFNNVPLVGHSHPRVVKAAQQQMALLNTNTRYLHDNIGRYAMRLTGLMPEPLRVCYFLNSASEANELALRLARTHTRQHDIIVLDNAYHGHTTTLVDISPFKFNGPGGEGCKPWVHIAPVPDDYRGQFKRSDLEAGRKYARSVAELIAQIQSSGKGLAAYIAETLPSVGGQIVFPAGYLAEVYKHVHAAGGLSIADEVQVGFGRLGTHFWGFQTQNVVPDIVVLGKPIGNAFPLAAVVTTPKVAASFDNGMEFFSTFGGNPVACAVGLAVLDVLEEENLQTNARDVGGYLIKKLRALMEHHPLVGDVRGLGLFIGVELVRDRVTLEPATEEASYVVNRLRETGFLTGTDGPYKNILKIRPPLCFTKSDADLFSSALDEILSENPVRI